MISIEITRVILTTSFQACLVVIKSKIIYPKFCVNHLARYTSRNKINSLLAKWLSNYVVMWSQSVIAISSVCVLVMRSLNYMYEWIKGYTAHISTHPRQYEKRCLHGIMSSIIHWYHFVWSPCWSMLILVV